MSKVYLNDTFINNNKPIIQSNDRGFLLSDGIFETILAINNKLCFYIQHVERLFKSARLIDIKFEMNPEKLLSICQELLKLNALDSTSASIRITLTRGCSQRGINTVPNAMPTLLITCSPYTQVNNSISCYITKQKRNEYCQLSNIKTLYYLPSVLARKEAKDNGFDEGILTNSKNTLVSTSIGNLFLVVGNCLITPPLSDGALNGITRGVIKNICAELNIECVEKTIIYDDLKIADGAFHTNSLIGIQEFKQIDAVKFISDDNIKSIKKMYNKIQGKC